MKRTLANRIADLAPRPAIVTIDGPSGAGKTFLGEALSRELAAGGLHSLLLEVELWAHGWSDLSGAVDRVRSVVADLQEGPVTTRTWNWWTESEEPPIVLHPRPVIIVVGCGAGQIPSHLSIWIDADEELRASRVAAGGPTYDAGLARALQWPNRFGRSHTEIAEQSIDARRVIQRAPIGVVEDAERKAVPLRPLDANERGLGIHCCRAF